MRNDKKPLDLGAYRARSRNNSQVESPVPIEADIHGWLLDQASALRARRFDSVDCVHLAEELETMAGAERRALRRQLKRLLVHLLKLRAQADQLHRHGSWRRSIRNAREELSDLVADSPGILQRKADEVLAQVHARARIAASEESRLPLRSFPEKCPWSFDDILRADFFPGPPLGK